MWKYLLKSRRVRIPLPEEYTAIFSCSGQIPERIIKLDHTTITVPPVIIAGGWRELILEIVR